MNTDKIRSKPDRRNIRLSFFNKRVWQPVIALVAAIVLMMPSSGAAQNRDITLTVYTNGLGLVQEVRTVELARGRSTVRLPGIAPQIDPTSVRVRSLTAPDRVSVLEQRYLYDLVSSDAVLLKYKGRDIELSVSGSSEPVRGRLLGLGGDLTLMREDGRIEIIRRDTVLRVRLPELPEGLTTEPVLEWTVANAGNAGSHRMEIGYLAEGLTWHAEYTAVVDEQASGMRLSGWISIENHAGMTFENAALILVAGEVHRAAQARPMPGGGRGGMAMRAEAAPVTPQFEEQGVFEYHTYALDRRATIAHNATVQLALLEDTKTQVVKQYVYDGARMGAAVQTRLKLENRERNGLGFPLPRGTVRIYQEAEGARRFIGEDRIRDLAKDETAYLTVGNAFDVTGERTQTDARRMGDRSSEESFRVVLRNHTGEQVTVKVVERMSSLDWVIRDASHAYEKRDARTVEFDAPVPADGETAVTYTVVYRW